MNVKKFLEQISVHGQWLHQADWYETFFHLFASPVILTNIFSSNLSSLSRMSHHPVFALTIKPKLFLCSPNNSHHPCTTPLLIFFIVHFSCTSVSLFCVFCFFSPFFPFHPFIHPAISFLQYKYFPPFLFQSFHCLCLFAILLVPVRKEVWLPTIRCHSFFQTRLRHSGIACMQSVKDSSLPEPPDPLLAFPAPLLSLSLW